MEEVPLLLPFNCCCPFLGYDDDPSSWSTDVCHDGEAFSMYYYLRTQAPSVYKPGHIIWVFGGAQNGIATVTKDSVWSLGVAAEHIIIMGPIFEGERLKYGGLGCHSKRSIAKSGP
jgi:hypothetical protein